MLRPPWPWVLGTVLIALLGWGIATRDQGEAPSWTPRTADELTAMRLYTLTDAIAAAGGDGAMETIRDQARALESSPRGTPEHADIARDAFIRAAHGLSDLQARRYPVLGTAAAEVRAAATGVSPTRSLYEQREAVATFFESCRELLTLMAADSSANVDSERERQR